MQLTLFYIAAVVGVIATVMVITRYHAVHALLYLVVSLLSAALIFYLVGAPFVAALEVIIYAGAIMTLFIFVMMMLNLGEATIRQEKSWLSLKAWIGPAILVLILFAQFLIMSTHSGLVPTEKIVVSPKEVSVTLFSKYLLGVEMAGMLLLTAVVGAYHLGRKKKKIVHRYLERENDD